MEDFFDLLTKFVAVAGSIDYGIKLIKLLMKWFAKYKSPRRHKSSGATKK